MLTSHFLAEFKRLTELEWRSAAIDPNVSGFQAQPGTRWNPGLSDEEIAQYESLLGTRFPDDFRAFLRVMNGTDLPRVNVYGSRGHPTRQYFSLYSYPRDIELVQQRLQDIRAEWDELVATMADQGFELAREAVLVPFFQHRYVVCTSNPSSSVVLSVADSSDVIVYGYSFKEYLEREFLQSRA